LVDRLLVFSAAIVYLCILPPIVPTGTTVMMPFVCLFYTCLVYLLVRSPDVLIKSVGYGAAVAPILVFAELHPIP
jgi:hypothetical protein